MRYLSLILIVGLLTLAPIGNLNNPSQAVASEAEYSGYPTFSILSVKTDQTVTIKTYNLPPNDTFSVLMNTMGTRGLNGFQVATLNTGAGGSKTLTYNIPVALHGKYQIAVRLQSISGSGYFAYNWFYNKTSGGSGSTTPGYSGFPTFSIVSVVRDSQVTIQTKNLPANDTFAVLMNTMGTRGVNGIQVATLNTGSGGSQELTYNIPAALQGLYQIAIRLESTTGSGYFAYNWFYNNTTGGSTGGGSQPPPATGYTGFPTFSIQSVVRNTSVTIKTQNLPPNDTFAVLMNFMGTRGINGYQVATLNTGGGGSQVLTYNVPAALAGQYQIAVRLQSTSGSGYFAYNWFYNNTTP
jgi:hypothetical protein